MVCPRCISTVSQILSDLNLDFKTIKLGEVELISKLDELQREALARKLQGSGFNIINDRKSQLIEQMKNLVVEKVHHSNEETDEKWADIISGELNLDYKYLSSLFSSVESITFEQYIINQKIERVKELIAHTGSIILNGINKNSNDKALYENTLQPYGNKKNVQIS